MCSVNVSVFYFIFVILSRLFGRNVKTKPESTLQYILHRHSTVTDERTCQNRTSSCEDSFALYLKFIN